MPSFQLTTSPSRRAAARYVQAVRRALQKALAVEAELSGLSQSEVARRIDVHRSVVNRELKGTKDITQGRVGELAWAMGYEPVFTLRKVELEAGSNSDATIEYMQHAPASSVGEWPAGISSVVKITKLIETVG